MIPKRLNRFAPLALAGFVLAAWLAPAMAQNEAIPGPGADAEPGVRKLAVPFEHNDHNKKAKIASCSVCHHGLKNGRRVQSGKTMEKRCSTCHQERPMTQADPPSLMSVGHAQCQGCHKKTGKGPVGCSQCHKQQ